jgi:hypothetical protein
MQAHLNYGGSGGVRPPAGVARGQRPRRGCRAQRLQSPQKRYWHMKAGAGRSACKARKSGTGSYKQVQGAAPAEASAGGTGSYKQIQGAAPAKPAKATVIIPRRGLGGGMLY